MKGEGHRVSRSPTFVLKVTHTQTQEYELDESMTQVGGAVGAELEPSTAGRSKPGDGASGK